MRLFIAEKPSLARAIADVLPKPHRKGDGFIECGNGQVVTGVSGTCLNRRSRMSTTAATPAGISTICQLCRKSGVCNRVLPSPNSSTSLSASCMRRRKWSTRVTRTGKGNCWSMKCWTTWSWRRKSVSRCSAALSTTSTRRRWSARFRACAPTANLFPCVSPRWHVPARTGCTGST